jgi:ankyrin repeat protein
MGKEEWSEYTKESDFVIRAQNGDLDKCRELLASGVNINANNHRGTALGAAARNNEIEMCRFLLSKGADIILHSVEGETPLMLVWYTAI